MDSESPSHAFHRLKAEMDRLSDEQNEVVERATFLGLTTDDVSEYEARRVKILDLVEQLRQIGNAGLNVRGYY